MSEPHDPFGGAGESAPAAQQPAPLPTRAWGREGRGAVAIGLAGALLLVVALVATGPLWAPLLPWAARIEAIDQATHNQAVGDPTDIALVLTLLQIRDAIEAGRPFATGYETLIALAQARPEIAAAAAPLAEPAINGLPGR